MHDHKAQAVPNSIWTKSHWHNVWFFQDSGEVAAVYSGPVEIKFSELKKGTWRLYMGHSNPPVAKTG